MCHVCDMNENETRETLRVGIGADGVIFAMPPGLVQAAGGERGSSIRITRHAAHAFKSLRLHLFILRLSPNTRASNERLR